MDNAFIYNFDSGLIHANIKTNNTLSKLVNENVPCHKQDICECDVPLIV